jgi:hypothetical protein
MNVVNAPIISFIPDFHGMSPTWPSPLKPPQDDSSSHTYTLVHAFLAVASIRQMALLQDEWLGRSYCGWHPFQVFLVMIHSSLEFVRLIAAHSACWRWY